jgi:hypothetical protein
MKANKTGVMGQKKVDQSEPGTFLYQTWHFFVSNRRDTYEFSVPFRSHCTETSEIS